MRIVVFFFLNIIIVTTNKDYDHILLTIIKEEIASSIQVKSFLVKLVNLHILCKYYKVLLICLKITNL